MQLLAHPWRSLSGDLSEDRFPEFQRMLLSYLLLHPGCSLASLRHAMPLLTHAELEDLLQFLKLQGVVEERALAQETCSLFSQPFNWEDQAEEEDDEENEGAGSAERRRKRRKNKRRRREATASAADSSATPPMQRYLFPTQRAFAV